MGKIRFFYPRVISQISLSGVQEFTLLYQKIVENQISQEEGGGGGGQWLSGRLLVSRSRGCGLEPHRRHCIVSVSKTH